MGKFSSFAYSLRSVESTVRAEVCAMADLLCEATMEAWHCAHTEFPTYSSRGAVPLSGHHLFFLIRSGVLSWSATVAGCWAKVVRDIARAAAAIASKITLLPRSKRIGEITAGPLHIITQVYKGRLS
jgi:hypothetical protein